ncbi:MAG: YcjF family protein [Sandaracinaceae bacterium]
MTETKTRASDNEMDDWVAVVDRLPFIASVKRDFTSLRRMLYDRRAPRVAVVGAQGSGRTALANALLGAEAFDEAVPHPEPGTWMRIDAAGRRLDWLELPATDAIEDTEELAWRAFEDQIPDVLIGMVEAGNEAAASDVSVALAALRAQLDKEHGLKLEPLVVVSKVDRLPPADAAPPYPSEKRNAVDLSLQATRHAMAALKRPTEAFMAVSAAPVATDGTSGRWNLDVLSDAILERLPDAAQMEGARAFDVGQEARRKVARALVNSASALAVTVGLAPVPFADVFVLLPLQGAMVTGIAYLSGRPWDRRAGAEWIASMGVAGGAGIGLRWGARQLVKLVPGAGSLVGAGIAGAGTLAIGRSAIAYFIDGPGARPDRLELRADNPQ